MTVTNPLLAALPALATGLPHVALGDWPTPVEPAESLLPGLYVKRDDLSGRPYGGNKVRKLEFLLGQALRDGRRTLITGGYAGSNHALATAVYAARLGLACSLLLLHQLPARYVRRNLLLGYASGARQLAVNGLPALFLAGAGEMVRGWRRDGRWPQIVPAGGSSPLGAVGYVAAAFELRDQIAAGLLPPPDVIYVALGTMGTAAGLLVGLKLAGLTSRVVAVRITESRYANERGLGRLIRRTADLLRRHDPGLPAIELAEADLTVRHDFFGGQYARFTSEGMAAVRQARAAGLRLEGTYTGKTLAALLADAAAGRLAGQAVLFWNTYDSHDFGALIGGIDYRRLPPALHRYFTAPPQPLDEVELAG